MENTIVTCTATNTKGERCGMRPLSGDPQCYIHSPTVAEERAEMRSAAGKKGSRVQRLAAAGKVGIAIRPADTTSVEDLQRYLSDILIGVQEGSIPTTVANTLMAGARMAIQLCGLALDVKLASKIK